MAVLLAILALAGLAASPALAQGDWKQGRGTFYGTDAWSIHSGSCGYGHLSNERSTGWNVAAMADANYDFRGSCGKCKEVKCGAFDFKDGYGQTLERRNNCYNTEASVVVQITDTCPCVYGGNYYSNKRWCCGDMYHMDLSVWTFEKLAPKDKGVIGLYWRDVPCNYKPRVAARMPWGQQPSSSPYSPPSGWSKYDDKRPFPSSGRRMLA